MKPTYLSQISLHYIGYGYEIFPMMLVKKKFLHTIQLFAQNFFPMKMQTSKQASKYKMLLSLPLLY